MNYSKMKINCVKELSELICFLDWNFNEKLIKKVVEFSSFNKVKKMGEEKGQKYGNGPKDGTFKGEFTRSGEEGQFYNELNKETGRNQCTNPIFERYDIGTKWHK